MALIKIIKDRLGNIIYPQTREKAVYSESNERLDNKLSNLHVGADGKPVFDNLTVGNRLNGSLIGENSTAMGTYNIASGQSSHAEGYNTNASGITSHTEGQGTIAKADTAHAEGLNTKAYSYYSHAEGQNSQAGGSLTVPTIGQMAHAEGWSTVAMGDASHSEGRESIASGGSSHVEGYNNVSSGPSSHAEGHNNTASGAAAHVEGDTCTATGNYSHSGGAYSQSNGANSFAHGLGSIANGSQQTVFGRYNIADTTSLLIVGNGTSDGARSDAFVIQGDGQAYVTWLNATLAMTTGSVSGSLRYCGNLPFNYNLQFTGITIAANASLGIGIHNLPITGQLKVLPAVIVNSSGALKGICNLVLNTASGGSGILIMNGGVAIASTDLIRLGNAIN